MSSENARDLLHSFFLFNPHNRSSKPNQGEKVPRYIEEDNIGIQTLDGYSNKET